MHAPHSLHPIGHSLLVEGASVLQHDHVDLRIQFVDGYVGDAELDVPIVLPLLVLHALPGRPGQGYGLPLQLMPVQVPERSCRVHSAVHADEGASSRRNDIDRVHLSVFAEEIRKVVLGHQLGQMAHPQCHAAH